MAEAKNYTVTIINSLNQSIVLEGKDPSDYALTGVDGVEATDYSQNINENGNFPGGIRSGAKVSSRRIDLDFVLMHTEREQSNRLYLESFLNPYEEYDLVVSRMSVTRHIKAYIYSKPKVSQTHLGALQYWSVSFVAPKPFFMAMSDYGQDIASVTGMFAPPFLMNATTGQIMGVAKSDELTTISNDGDMDVGLSARFVAKDQVKNIKLYNARNPDEYVRVIDTLETGDIIVITTGDGEKTIKKTSGGVTTNIINKLDRTSNFFKIHQGSNIIGYEADLNQNALEVWLNYTPLYYGV